MEEHIDCREAHEDIDCCVPTEGGSLSVSLDTSQLVLGAVLIGVVGGVVAAVANTVITAALVFLIS
jgi:hypothetical protein